MHLENLVDCHCRNAKMLRDDDPNLSNATHLTQLATQRRDFYAGAYSKVDHRNAGKCGSEIYVAYLGTKRGSEFGIRTVVV
jgi:hypothetical protein